MKLYPESALWSEITYLAYHLHWDLERLLDLEHPDRARNSGRDFRIGRDDGCTTKPEALHQLKIEIFGGGEIANFDADDALRPRAAEHAGYCGRRHVQASRDLDLRKVRLVVQLGHRVEQRPCRMILGHGTGQFAIPF